MKVTANMLFLLVLAALVVTFTRCSGKPPAPWVCAHPAVMGGFPFPLAEQHVFTTNGILRFKLGDTDSEVFLTGAQCVKIQEGK